MSAAKVRFGLFFLILLNLIDTASTFFFLYIGGEELNPLMSFFIRYGSLGKFVLAKIILVFLYVVMMLWYTRRKDANPRLVKFAIIVPTAVYALSMITHIITWVLVLQNA